MEGSFLTVHVVEARGLKPMDIDGTSDPYVILQIENQKIETTFKKSTLDPVWNESFQFEITHGNDPLFIEVMDKDTFGQDDSEGICELSLKDYNLHDQQKVDLWLDLFDKVTRKQTQGRLRLMVQFVHSKVKYYEDMLTKWDDAISRQVEIKDYIQLLLVQMQNPFACLNIAKVVSETDSTTLERLSNQIDEKI